MTTIYPFGFVELTLAHISQLVDYKTHPYFLRQDAGGASRVNKTARSVGVPSCDWCDEMNVTIRHIDAMRHHEVYYVNADTHKVFMFNIILQIFKERLILAIFGSNTLLRRPIYVQIVPKKQHLTLYGGDSGQQQ